MIDILAVNEPSMLNSTVYVLGGNTVSEKSTDVWSPLSYNRAQQEQLQLLGFDIIFNI